MAASANMKSETNAFAQSIRDAKCNDSVRQEYKDALAKLFAVVPESSVATGRRFASTSAGSSPEIRGDDTFGEAIISRSRVTEMYLYRKEEEPKKWEAKVVMEIVVLPSMVNIWGTLHGGCTSFLIDVCSSFPLSLLALHIGKSPMVFSQNLNILFHAPVSSGAKLKIIAYTLSVGSRTLSSRCEIYDATNSRMIASGTHTKMESPQIHTSRL